MKKEPNEKESIMSGYNAWSDYAVKMPVTKIDMKFFYVYLFMN